MKEKFEEFMRGRYGGDELSRFGIILAIILTIISSVTEIAFFYWAGFFAMIYFGIFRVFSKNISKRYQERVKYLNAVEPIRKFFRERKKERALKKNYEIFRCPDCGTKMKVPKGKGKVKISCPECKKEFIEKT